MSDKMRRLHVVMPMAGEGSRFRDAGWETPKPLIMLRGKPLFMRAIGSVAVPGVEMRYSLIVRAEHIRQYGLDEQIRRFLPGANIYAVERTTRGAVETCMLAAEGIADDEGVVVMDCDLEFRSRAYTELIARSLSRPQDSGGALVSFSSSEPRYSYAAVGEDGLVVRTAEKEVISRNALCGAYYFAWGGEFKAVARRLLAEPVMTKPEYYVSLLYNYLLADGSPVRLARMEEYRSYGTPQELMQYL